MSGPDRELAVVAPELFVPDVEAAVRFYVERLGFTLLRQEGQGAAATFAVVALGPATILIAHDSHYGAMGGTLDGARGVGLDVRIMVPDVDAVERLARANDVAIVYAIANRYYGLRDFVVRDPHGYRIRFASPT